MQKQTIILGIGMIALSVLVIALAFIEYNLAQLPAPERNITKPIIKLDVDKQPRLEFISGTEYSADDTYGGTIIKLTDWKGDYIDTDCYETILKPDRTPYLDWILMEKDSTFGNYYINFTSPDVEGIYDMEIKCFVQNKNISIGKGFHVNSEEKVGIETYG